MQPIRKKAKNTLHSSDLRIKFIWTQNSEEALKHDLPCYNSTAVWFNSFTFSITLNHILSSDNSFNMPQNQREIVVIEWHEDGDKDQKESRIKGHRKWEIAGIILHPIKKKNKSFCAKTVSISCQKQGKLVVKYIGFFILDRLITRKSVKI